MDLEEDVLMQLIETQARLTTAERQLAELRTVVREFGVFLNEVRLQRTISKENVDRLIRVIHNVDR